MELEKERRGRSSVHERKWHKFNTATELLSTETHAFDTMHLDKMKPFHKFSHIEVKSDPFFAPRQYDEDDNDRNVNDDYLFPTRYLDKSGAIYNTAELSVISEKKSVNRNESIKYLREPLEKLKNDFFNQTNPQKKQKIIESEINGTYSSDVDHVYEEVNSLECDIVDYYEKYSPTTAKTLINTLFLPRQKICKQCANLQISPVYSDHLIFGKEILYAKEIHIMQQNETTFLKYCSEDEKPTKPLFMQYDNDQHCLLVYNCIKTNASSIFYHNGLPRDTFDLKQSLKPTIVFLTHDSKETVNTELYHRSANNFYTRISNRGIVSTVFHMNSGNVLSPIKNTGYDTDLQNWLNYRDDVFRSHCPKQDDVIDVRANRSSLLFLEPLLLMPELSSNNYRQEKNRISQKEHVKIVKIVIAYTLTFLILATVTFYIVYFT